MKILVCYDGSEASLRAVDKAHHLIKDCGINEVTLIHGYTHYSRGPIAKDKHAEPSLLQKLKESEKKSWLEKQEILEEIAETFEQKGTKINICMIEGNPAEVIIKEAEEGDYDFVVIGRRGRGNLKNMVMGSVSNGVLQGTKVTVLIVK